MTSLTIALVNLKPGTGKTTSAVWLAHAFAAEGRPVLLVDADPAASALDWSDLAGGFHAFRMVGLPVRDLPRRVAEIAKPDEVVIIDSPQVEDHAGIARAAMRYADEVVVPCAPTPIEINRTVGMRNELEDVNALRDYPARCCVLLNRTIHRASSTADAREALEQIGMDVLRNPVPRLEVFATSFGGKVLPAALGVWGNVAGELMERAGMGALAR